MAKFKEKIKAHKLRKQGWSIKEIAKKLKISKGTVSIWCRDIKLTKKQRLELEQKMIEGGHRGRLKGVETLKKRYLERVELFKKEGAKQIGRITKRDLFIAGIGLYWGEGDKKDNNIRIGNSDPKMIKFILYWLKEVWDINNDRIKLHIGINYIHKKRLEKVKKYWAKVTGISENQFGKIVLIKAKNKKVYDNFNNHYGTLSIRVRKSSSLKYQMDGMLELIRHFIK